MACRVLLGGEGAGGIRPALLWWGHSSTGSRPEVHGGLAVAEQVGEVQDVVAVQAQAGAGGAGGTEGGNKVVVFLNAPAVAPLLAAVSASGGVQGLLEIGD